ncbi:cytochrome d ubiquinol oxidase subunit II [Roseivivax sp. THAF30]|uniref:cytochrome d ubiquinol oxidase subunit II n=1 Tax=Roseivivax sp. THAF30 TaxID=2587852 RepID=UPI001267E57D|nr:cytochrome d ubiquinol oxidase subunit II [Roseivivax sp. THAF30]QFT63868.1 Cytochrome bd-I ubiquinol oxidase subunit 2 [Roseivivax sp. THAF30]
MEFFDLAFIWAGLIAFAVLVYVILDGFDLGIGILFPLAKSEKERDIMMNSVAPVWDGNETWLILGGGGLFAVFPLAYAVVMPALYMPITLMLLALVFRGVAFEYRWKTKRWKGFWSAAFFGGSLVATFCQGIALGALVQGIEIEQRSYAGGWFDWLTLFSLFCGAALVVGYALLGATWINMKTEGPLQERNRKLAGPLGVATLALIGVVSTLTPFQDPVYYERWFTLPAAFWSYLVPVFLILISYFLFSGLAKNKDYQPFFMANALFIVCFVGIGISFYPHIVPPSLTIDAAAAPDSSLLFALVGAGILIPIILIYTAYAYWVFRGKIDENAGYH